MPSLIVILGPTASGKTAAAITLAQGVNGEVVSADSRQVYAGFDIGTAKPTEAHAVSPHAATQADTVEGTPHYLLNVSSPTDLYSLAKWQHDAYKVIDAIIASGKQPILAGGTMLYLDSIMYNYTIPEVPPNQVLREQLQAHSTEELYTELLAQDPSAKAFIEPNNSRRIIRALEVIAVTGLPFSALRKKHRPRYQVKIIGLFPGWDVLKKNIEVRAQQMLHDGLANEYRQLQERYTPTLPLLHTMNYKQVGQFLAGEMVEKDLLIKMVQIHMRYAHRQMSWWNRNKDIEWQKSPAIAY